MNTASKEMIVFDCEAGFLTSDRARQDINDNKGVLKMRSQDLALSSRTEIDAGKVTDGSKEARPICNISIDLTLSVK